MSEPLSLEVPSVGVRGSVSRYTRDMIQAAGGYDPQPWETTIAWDETITGGMPGTDSTNTTYLYAHSHPTESAPFNNLKNIQVGDAAAVVTANGRLCYEVQYMYDVPKSDYATDLVSGEIVPGRLILVTCYRPDGYDPNLATTNNWIVILQLNNKMTSGGGC